MRFALVITVLACVSMMTLQATHMDSPKRSLKEEARRAAMVKQYWQARKRGLFKMPQQICPPALDAGTFIANQAISCAMQALAPGSGLASRLIKTGTKVAAKTGAMGPIMDMRTKFLRYVINKLLHYLGCPNQKRRMNFFKAIGNAANSVKNKVGHAANSAVKAVSHAANDVKKGVVKIGNTVVKSAADVAKITGKLANKAAAEVKAFDKKYGKAIRAVACPIVRKLCKPACTAAATGFMAAGSTINATFHIPVGCITNILEAGCNKLCVVVCGKRRLGIRKL